MLTSIPPELREKESSPLTLGPSGHYKALGLHWDTDQDCLHVSTPSQPVPENPTMRTVASDAPKVFDILGWFAPVSFSMKLLMQDLWKRKCYWDDGLPPDLKSKWLQWRQKLHLITEHAVPRRLFSQHLPRMSLQLHGFSDASLAGYGCIVYLRTLYNDTSIDVSLIAAKTRIALIAPSTVPCLELCGALLLAKLVAAISQDLNIPRVSIYAWTDSVIVLGWQWSCFTVQGVYTTQTQYISFLDQD